MGLSQAVKDYIIRFKDDLKKDKLDRMFGKEFEDLFSQTKQEVIDAFINSDVDIFESLITIDIGTFCFLTLPTVIKAPNVLAIGYNAFKKTNIEKVYIPNCEYIGMAAFSECENLKSIHAPNVNQLGEYVFEQCSSLTELSLPKVDIKSCAGLVIGCRHLKKLYLPNCEPYSGMTIDDIIYYLFGDGLSHGYTFDLEELYIKDNKNEDIDMEIAEDIGECMPNLKIIDADTGNILRNYAK